MDQQVPHFVHEYHSQTTLHPLGMLLLLSMAALMFGTRRSLVMWPLILIACFIAPAQRLVVLGSDFTFLRLMILVGWARVAVREEWRPIYWWRLDTCIIIWTVAQVIFGVANFGSGMLMNRLGYGFDAAATYFLARVLIRDLSDVEAMVRGFTYVCVPVVIFFAVEWQTRHNLFSVLGGVPEVTVVREGRLRCQGAFAHPILAGLFWASLLPLIAVQWWSRAGGRLLAVIGIFAALFIVFTCSSATPVVAVVCAAAGGAAFYLRHHLRIIRYGLLVSLVGLHVVMVAPVWHLISRIDIVGGSSGYHRFMLIDNAIRYLNEWWLTGSTVGTSHWGYGMHDVTNSYLVQGLRGGIVQLGLYVAIIVVAFSGVGRLCRAEAGRGVRLYWAWALGVAVFVHATSFLVITYFGQIVTLWYLLLGAVGSLTSPALLGHPSATTQVRPVMPALPHGRTA